MHSVPDPPAQPKADKSGSPERPPGPLVLEDRPEPLKPRRVPSEEDRDRLEALSLFSAARTLDLDGEYADALRLYERALRYDPEADSIVGAIIPLAVIRLKRYAEAVRYYLYAPELQDVDPVVLGRLGVYLAERGDWQRAATLYERALAARGDAATDAADLVLRMQLGRLYHLTGQYKKAADVFGLVFEALQHPDDFKLNANARKLLFDEPQATYSLLGECFLLGGRLDKAAAAFRKADEASPDKGLLSFHLARVDAAAKKPQSALKRLQICFDEHRADLGTAPYQLLAESLTALGRRKELAGRLEKLRADDPQNVPLGYFLADTYLGRKQFDKAEPLYRDLVAKAPALAGYRALAEIYRSTGRHGQLLDTVAETVDKTAALEPLGDQFKAIVDDAGLVQSLLDVAQDRFDNDAKAFGYARRLAAALVALEAGKYDAAGGWFDRAIEAKPDQAAELLLSWGLGLLVAEQYDSAAKVFQRGLDKKVVPEENPVFYFYLAGALEMAGHTDEALRAAREAVRIKPDSPRSHGRVAWILYHADRNEEAIKAYRELIEQFDGDFGSSEVREVLRDARLVLSNLAVLTGRKEEADEWLEQVLDEFPEDTSARNDLGYLWADAGKNLRRAHRMIRQAIEAEPDNPAYRDSLGWVLYRLGRFDEAVTALEKAVADEPDPVILDHLGDVYKAIQKFDEARQTWRQALEGFQKDHEAENAEEVQRKIDSLE